MKKLLMTLLIVLLASTFGCMPVLKKRPIIVPEPEPAKQIAPLLSVGHIDKKIDFIIKILQQEGLSAKDKKIALTLLETYQSLKDASSEHMTETRYRDLSRILFETLCALDKNYFSKKRGLPLDYSGPISLFVGKRNKILDTYLYGDFKGVIKQCLELKESFGPDALTPEIGLVFALSLGEEGKLKDAVSIGEGIARKMEANPDVIHLRAKIAEWQLSLGQREKALHMYDKLTDSLDERETLIKGLTQKITGNAQPGDKIDTERSADWKTEDQDLSPMDKLLLKVDALVQKNAYDEARLLLIKHRIRLEEGPEMEIIDEALKGIEIAEEQFEKEKRSEDTYINETIETTKKLIEEESFEDAISKINELQYLHGTSSESMALKNRAIEKLINRERNRAAKLFLAAKKTQDRAKKEEFLLSSYKILKEIIDKYPSSPLNDKLKSHIKTLTKEMERLGITPEG